LSDIQYCDPGQQVRGCGNNGNHFRVVLMTIEFPCWNCGVTIHAAEAHANKHCKCANCGSVNRILGTRADTEKEVGYTTLEPSRPRGLPELEQREPELRSSGLVGVLGFLFLLLGLGVLAYYLFFFTTEIPELVNTGLVVEAKVEPALQHRQLIGSFCGGVLTVAGAIMLGLGALRR
jgi:hypothetical protein